MLAQDDNRRGLSMRTNPLIGALALLGAPASNSSKPMRWAARSCKGARRTPWETCRRQLRPPGKVARSGTDLLRARGPFGYARRLDRLNRASVSRALSESCAHGRCHCVADQIAELIRPGQSRGDVPKELGAGLHILSLGSRRAISMASCSCVYGFAKRGTSTL